MTVTEGVELARQHLVSVLPDYEVSGLQLEELETPPAGAKWKFTFSTILPVRSDGGSSLAEILRGRRILKSVEIDSTEGALLSIKNASV